MSGQHSVSGGGCRGGVLLRWTLLLLAAVLAALVFLRRTTSEEPVAAPSGRPASAEPAPLGVEPVGDPEAALQVTCVVGGEYSESLGLIDFLTGAAAEQPSRLRVEFLYRHEAGEFEVIDPECPFCGAVLVNGVTVFTVPHGDDGARVTELVGTLGADYSVADVAAVLRLEYRSVYGEAPPAGLFRVEDEAQAAARTRESVRDELGLDTLPDAEIPLGENEE